MRVLAFRERKRRVEVLLEQRSLFDARHQQGIYLLLQVAALQRLLVDGVEQGVGRLFLLRACRLGKVSVGKVGELEARDVDRGLGGNDVGLVDAAQSDAVDAVWARDEQQARRQLAQEHDALSSVAAGQQDQHGAGGDALAQGDGGKSLAGLLAVLALDGHLARLRLRRVGVLEERALLVGLRARDERDSLWHRKENLRRANGHVARYQARAWALAETRRLSQ